MLVIRRGINRALDLKSLKSALHPRFDWTPKIHYQTTLMTVAKKFKSSIEIGTRNSPLRVENNLRFNFKIPFGMNDSMEWILSRFLKIIRAILICDDYFPILESQIFWIITLYTMRMMMTLTKPKRTALNAEVN